jgi:hypothetical protein
MDIPLMFLLLHLNPMYIILYPGALMHHPILVCLLWFVNLVPLCIFVPIISFIHL